MRILFGAKFYCDSSSLWGFQECYGRGFSTIIRRWNISQAQSVKYFCSTIDNERRITFVLGSANCQILNVSIITFHLCILSIWIVFFFNIWITIFHINDLPPCYGRYFLVSPILSPRVAMVYKQILQTLNRHGSSIIVLRVYSRNLFILRLSGFEIKFLILNTCNKNHYASSLWLSNVEVRMEYLWELQSPVFWCQISISGWTENMIWYNN